MAACPACGSSRIRNDYKPAPLWLRLVGMRALLCDYCNYQFRAFSPLPPKSRRPRPAPHKAAVFNPAPVVNLQQLGRPGAEALPAPPAKPAPVMNLNRVPLVTEQITPVRSDLRTQITRLQAQGAHDTPEPAAPSEAVAPPATSTPLCPECGSPDVKRRHRNAVEKAMLSLTAHKAYTCRHCGVSFYAKKEGESAPPPLSPADQNLLESSAFNRERG